MKRPYQALLAVLFFLSACVDHWEGGGRRQELPVDERTVAPGGASSDAGGTTVAGLEPEQSSGASANSNGGAAGAGGLDESAGLALAGTAGIPGLP